MGEDKMMKKLAGLAAIAAACVGCDKVAPEYEFGYKDGPSIERNTDIGQMAVVRELGTSNTYPANVKMDYVNRTMRFKDTAYGTEPVKYEWAGNDQVVAKSSTTRNGKRVDYEATVFMER